APCLSEVELTPPGSLRCGLCRERREEEPGSLAGIPGVEKIRRGTDNGSHGGTRPNGGALGSPCPAPVAKPLGRLALRPRAGRPHLNGERERLWPANRT